MTEPPADRFARPHAAPKTRSGARAGIGTMKNNFLKDRPGLRRMIRYTEIAVVAILLVYAALIYRELKMLRAAPVVLPAYWFNVATEAGQVQRVHARGSWVGKEASPEFLHTTTIECVKSKMQCMESSAVVAVNDGRFLESIQTMYDVESWTDTEIHTKSDVQPCAMRSLTLDLANKQAKTKVVNKATVASCKSSPSEEQTLNLVTGFQANADGVRRAR